MGERDGRQQILEAKALKQASEQQTANWDCIFDFTEAALTAAGGDPPPPRPSHGAVMEGKETGAFRRGCSMNEPSLFLGSILS